jgi:hypothetical protein
MFLTWHWIPWAATESHGMGYIIKILMVGNSLSASMAIRIPFRNDDATEYVVVIYIQN